MRIFKEENRPVKVVAGFICDCCDRSCDQAEFLELKANWGYWSKWDNEDWEAHVCQECVETKLMEIIKFNRNAMDQWL